MCSAGHRGANRRPVARPSRGVITVADEVPGAVRPRLPALGSRRALQPEVASIAPIRIAAVTRTCIIGAPDLGLANDTCWAVRRWRVLVIARTGPRCSSASDRFAGCPRCGTIVEPPPSLYAPLPRGARDVWSKAGPAGRHVVRSAGSRRSGRRGFRLRGLPGRRLRLDGAAPLAGAWRHQGHIDGVASFVPGRA